jgi:hypothetical protein
MLSKPLENFPCFYIYLSLTFSGAWKEGRRRREFMREDVGVRKGGHQLYSPAV